MTRAQLRLIDAILVMVAGFVLIAVALAAGPPIRPDAKLTPGATLPVTAKEVCVPGYAASVRHVTDSEKKAVFKVYGINPKSGKFEVDHLISLELGGSNDVKNLWPQSYTTAPWNAHLKDALEDRLHKLVCDEKDDDHLSLADAQRVIRTDWITAYKRYVGPEPAK